MLTRLVILRDALTDSQLDSYSDSMLTRDMALRVLLADESVTIKKVFQLTLQDFAVDVMNVTVGVDVLQAAEQFKPDIVFADVILPKKSGYDVCRDIKNHPQMAATPVVLIWSGFMELDQAKFKSSGADDSLEKPFDAQRLRTMVTKWVSKTRTQTLSDHLSFPRLPDFVEERKPAPPPLVHTPPPPPVTKPWSMDNFAPLEAPNMNTDSQDEISAATREPEEFLTVRLPTDPPRPQTELPSIPGKSKSTLDDEETDNPWVQKSLAKYKLNPTPTETTNTASSDDDSELLELDLNPAEQDEIPPQRVTPASPKLAPSGHADMAGMPHLSEKQIEDIIRSQAKEVIEKVVWQVVPEIATRVIERELQRLLSERTKL